MAASFPTRPEPVWVTLIRPIDAWVRLAVRVRVQGLENIPATGAVLLVANHVSHLDPVVLLSVVHRAGRRVRFLAVEELFARPVIGWIVRAGRQIPVGSDAAGRTLALRRALDALRAGQVVLLYPEGTIPDAATAAAQGGAGLLALTSRAPVVPLATRGLERGRPGWRRRRADVLIGRPLDFSVAAGLRGRARYQAASQRCLSAVRALQAELEPGW